MYFPEIISKMFVKQHNAVRQFILNHKMVCILIVFNTILGYIEYIYIKYIVTYIQYILLWYNMVVNVWFVFLGYCPTMFDGFACVNSTMDEEIVNVSCPNFTQMGFDAKSKLKQYRNNIPFFIFKSLLKNNTSKKERIFFLHQEMYM